MSNPFTDQWDNNNPTIPNYTLPPTTSTNLNQQPIATNSQYEGSQFKNINIDQTTNNIQQQNRQNSQNQKSISSLPIKIFKELFSNYEMVICKLFYFLFYSAFGSLFPLIGIYFKQQGMSAIQTGILIGCRYIVEIFSSPFWFGLAERFQKGKAILISSLVSWIVLTSALAFIRPPTTACILYNGTDYIIYDPIIVEDNNNLNNVNRRNKRSLLNKEDLHIKYFKTGMSHYSIYKKKQKQKELNPDESDSVSAYDKVIKPPNHVIGKSPLTIEYSINYDEDKNSDYISPPFSYMVYRQSEVDEVFILLLLLMLIGEFFAAPTITLVDTVTIKQLSNNLNNYSKQRMFGSLGWAISMLLVGNLLDNSTEFTNHPCGPHVRERNYNICFKIFAFLMTMACIIATQFNFDIKNNEQIGDVQEDQNRTIENNELKARTVNSQVTINQNATSTRQTNIQSTDGGNSISFSSNGKKKKFELLDQLKSGVFAQSFNDRRLEWMSLIQNFTNIKLVTLICLAWFMGTGVGLVFSFLFWHLQDLGGTPTLFGIASVINHISEIMAYLQSLHFIKKYGHTRVLCFSLLCNFLRFLYISYIENPWLILPFELVQGVTHATAWATFCSYLNHTMPENSKSSTQALLQICYSGFGKGLGSIIGGYLINAYGTRITFAIYAFASLIAIFIFVFVMNVYKKKLAPTVNLGENRQASGRNRQTWLDDDLKNRNNLNINENQFVITPHGVPTHSTPIRTTPKQTQPTTKPQVEVKTDNNDDLDDYITRNHREWRISVNKHYEQ